MQEIMKTCRSRNPLKRRQRSEKQVRSLCTLPSAN